MIRIALATLALLLFLPAAQAASFDCAKAGTSFEKAICADEGLSQQDETLAQAYATALGGLSADATAEVKVGQKQWLSFAERACSDEAEPIVGTYTEDQIQCLGSLFRSRLRDLEASRMQGGYRFYPIDRFLVEPDGELQEGDIGYKPAEKEFHIVKIDRDDELGTAFNDAIDKMIVEQGEFFTDGTTDIAPGDTSSDYHISTEVEEVGTHRISLRDNQSWYGHGAAHGNFFITHHHFLIGPKRMLEASDIFAGADWEAKLGELATAKAKAEMGDGMFPDSEKDVPAIATDPRRWIFSDEGLGIQFNIYEVTPYAAGAPVITIPWDELEGLLAEDADKIIYY